MKTSYRSVEPKGIEDYLKGLCVIYRGEVDNPHDVNAGMEIHISCGERQSACGR